MSLSKNGWQKKKAGFIEPSLNIQLRNTKEIIAFENSLAPQKKSLASKNPIASSTKVDIKNTLETDPKPQSDTNESEVQPALDSNPDLKYGFCKKSLRKKETLNSCTFYLHKKVPVLMNHNI